MAIVNSTAIGAGKNSAGELTYRRIRGRTIASRRITTTSGKSTEAQKKQRGAFGIATQITKVLAPWINLSFPKTKYGSQRNNFIKNNNQLLQAFREDPDQYNGEKTSLGILTGAVKNFQIGGGKIIAGIGSAVVNTTVKESNGINIQITSSRPFKEGDIIRILLAGEYYLPGFSEGFEMCKVLEKIVDAYDLNSNGYTNVVDLDSYTFPDFRNPMKGYPEGAEFDELIIAVSVDQKGELSKSNFVRYEPPMMNGSYSLDTSPSGAYEIKDGKLIIRLTSPEAESEFLANVTNTVIGATFAQIDQEEFLIENFLYDGSSKKGLIVVSINPNLIIKSQKPSSSLNVYVMKRGRKLMEIYKLPTFVTGRK